MAMPKLDLTTDTLEDALERLGDVPPRRIRWTPRPGTAREEDVLGPNGEKRMCELVDGVLVEKAMGYYESRLAGILLQQLNNYLDEHDLGIVLGADGTLRLAPGLVRLPDVSFISWSRFPNRVLPTAPVPDLAPDLAVEILSAGNTRAEMERKTREYFAAGAQLVWLVDPDTRSVEIYTQPDRAARVDESGALDGGAVLPGFTFSIRRWFERAGRRGEQN